MSIFYNNYHKKNRNIQTKVISKSNYTYQTILKFISKYFTEKGSVLDIGCGVGTVSLFLASKGNTVTGVDISDKAIGLAKKSNKELGFDVRFETVDVIDLNYNELFDYVICSEVIEHVPYDEKLTKRIYKLLKNDGLLILSTPLESAPLYRWGKLKEFDRRVGHLRRYSKSGIIFLLEKSGFEVLEVGKTEGLLRNFLFTHDRFGYILKFAKWPFTYIFNLVDSILLFFFGPSNIYIVAKK